LVGKLLHPDGLLRVLDSQANNPPSGVQVEVDVFVKFASFDWQGGAEFDQCRIGVSKVHDAHNSLLEITVEEGIVHGLAIFKQDDPQGTVVHFGDARPAPYPSISLSFFVQRMLDGTRNPLVSDDGPVWALARVQKVLGSLHD